MFFFNSVPKAPGLRSAVAVTLGLAGFASSSFAASEDASSLQPVVVTATRTDSRIDAVVADVTVIDQARLRAEVGRSLPQVLSDFGGIQFASNGGLGKTSSLFIRGGQTRHALVLVDGMRFGSATTGSPSLENFPIESIDHIEVVRGPLASLYGSEAASGVVQIFTKRGKPGLMPTASVTVGNRDFLQGR